MKKLLSFTVLIGISSGVFAQEYLQTKMNTEVANQEMIKAEDLFIGYTNPLLEPLKINYSQSGTPSNSPGLIIKNKAIDDLGQAEIKLIPSVSQNEWSISANDDSNLFRLFSNSTARFAIDGDTGNIGVGSTTPSEKLHVIGLIRIPAASTINNDSPGLVLVGNDDFEYDDEYINQYGFGFHGYQDGSSSHANPYNTYISGHFGIDLFTGGQNRLRISKEGEVSIGTVNRQEGYKLAVNGKIKSKEIVVEADWSDYVFYKDYKLPTLTEVENHIAEKGHLINIPSATEVEANGIQLGAMNAKLLEKIEELTLYTIAQEKKLKTQEERLVKLEALLIK